MPRNRIIRPEFWDDEKLARLSFLARLIYIGTWTFSDDYGVVKGSPIWLKNKIFPYNDFTAEEFVTALDELSTSARLLSFESSGEKYYYIPNFLKYQKIDRPSQTSKNPNPPTDLSSTRAILVEPSTNTQRVLDDEDKISIREDNKRKIYIKKEKFDISRTIKNFHSEVYSYSDQFDKEFLDAFFNYWAEPNKSQTKIRMQLERTWNIELRLRRWTNYSRNFKNNGRAEKEILTDEEKYAKVKANFYAYWDKTGNLKDAFDHFRQSPFIKQIYSEINKAGLKKDQLTGYRPGDIIPGYKNLVEKLTVKT